MTVLHYCLRSKVRISQQFRSLLVKSIVSPNINIKENVIHMLSILYDEGLQENEENDIFFN